jgi:hypothetical protein
MLRRNLLPLYRPEYWVNSLSSKTLAHSYRTTWRRKPITAVWTFKTVKTWNLTLKYLLFYKNFTKFFLNKKLNILLHIPGWQFDGLTVHRLQLRLPQITSPLTQFFLIRGKKTFSVIVQAVQHKYSGKDLDCVRYPDAKLFAKIDTAVLNETQCTLHCRLHILILNICISQYKNFSSYKGDLINIRYTRVFGSFGRVTGG